MLTTVDKYICDKGGVGGGEWRMQVGASRATMIASPAACFFGFQKPRRCRSPACLRRRLIRPPACPKITTNTSSTSANTDIAPSIPLAPAIMTPMSASTAPIAPKARATLKDLISRLICARVMVLVATLTPLSHNQEFPST